MLFERGDECGKREQHRGAATDRGDVPELGRFSEEGACYLDFAGLVGGIIDIILCSDGPCINGSKEQILADEDEELVELDVEHSECQCRNDEIEIGIV